MPDWDADSPELRRNLASILEGIVDRADLRETPSAELARNWQRRLMQDQAVVAQLDRALPVGKKLNADQRDAVIDLCAWAHAEWVRIHPFANGNGRTARLWANFLAMRYGLPPFIRLRPRPDEGYADAGAKAMQGDWQPTPAVFRRLLVRFLDEDESGG